MHHFTPDSKQWLDRRTLNEEPRPNIPRAQQSVGNIAASERRGEIR